MTMETLKTLNTMTLIGCTEQRGHNAWHYRADLQGAEPNHYPGPIPVEDITRRLFNWQPLKVPAMAMVPCDIDDPRMTGIDENGAPYRLVAAPGRVMIMRSDNDFVLGAFKDGYEPHEYNEWLIGVSAELFAEAGVYDDLCYSSATLLRGGGIASVEVSVPETIHDPRSGFDYRPNLLLATSLDGSLSTTIKRTVTATVCDNTLDAALSESGQGMKVRHSRYSKLRMDDLREAVGMIKDTGAAFQQKLDTLIEQEVSQKQWIGWLDEFAPMPNAENPKVTPRMVTIAENKRSALTNLYFTDPRVADWTGTAFGVVQAANTYLHHVSRVSGDRGERNAERALTAKPGEIDGDAIAALDKVLDGRLLAAA